MYHATDVNPGAGVGVISRSNEWKVYERREKKNERERKRRAVIDIIRNSYKYRSSYYFTLRYRGNNMSVVYVYVFNFMLLAGELYCL